MEQGSYRMEDLIPVVSELARQYCGYERSSITYERAQELMEAVLYCIREQEACEQAALLTKDHTPMDAYLSGRSIVIEKFEAMQKIYGELTEDFEDYGVECLRDTIELGIPAFIQRYDIKFAPQDTLLTLDYPVLTPLERLTGIDAVLEYVTAVSLEQHFLKKLGAPYVMEALGAYCGEYESMVENICFIVLQDLAFCFILDKSLKQAARNEAERQKAKALLRGKSAGELSRYLELFLKNLILRQYDGDMRLFAYLKNAVSDLAARLF